jgi:hypothetical protein
MEKDDSIIWEVIKGLLGYIALPFILVYGAAIFIIVVILIEPFAIIYRLIFRK